MEESRKKYYEKNKNTQKYKQRIKKNLKKYYQTETYRGYLDKRNARNRVRYYLKNNIEELYNETNTHVVVSIDNKKCKTTVKIKKKYSDIDLYEINYLKEQIKTCTYPIHSI